jgi:uncharacterized protein YecE (DUF72 family)
MQPAKCYCGTSGIVLPVPNKQAFPEAFRGGTRLTYYASLFNSLEVNSSFYKIPQQKTLAHWVEEVPADFRFTVKLWRGITHVPSLAFAPADVQRFMQAASGIGPKKGALLVQLPPGLKPPDSEQLSKPPDSEQLSKPPAGDQRLKQKSRDQLERLLELISGEGWKIAVEFRDKAWYTPATDELLERFKAVRVLQDMPASFIWEPMSFSYAIYMRYHGPAGDYKGGYPEERLIKDAVRIKTWLNASKDVYVYFNNTIDGAYANAQTLMGVISNPRAAVGSR